MRTLLTGLLGCLLVGAGCGGPSASPQPAAPVNPRACEEAYADLVQYFKADLERRPPAALREDSFLSACRELPADAQTCMLFSFRQAHASQCDEVMSRVPPALMQRIASLVGK